MAGKYPSHASTNNVYLQNENKDGGWNQGFYSGILWIAYELTGDGKYKNLALSQIDEYYDRMVNVFGKMGHDVGFLYSLSCVAAYKLTGHKKAREAAIMAADHLKLAPETGVHLRGVTKQGRDDDSTWSRGHGWVVYGSMLVRKYIDDPDAMVVARAAVKFYLNRLPRDFVPFWDLEFVEEDGEEKDSSAAPIVLCGMLELLKKLDSGEERDMIENAVCTLCSLFTITTARRTTPCQTACFFTRYILSRTTSVSTSVTSGAVTSIWSVLSV